jgi:hypothetical protein
VGAKDKNLGIVFSWSAVEDGSSLQDLYEHALRRNRGKLAELLTRSFTVDPGTVPAWYRRILTLVAGELEFVHLNGKIQDIPDNVTFSTTQYAERLARPELWYLRFAGDLLTSPVIFVGTRLDERPLWQHLTLRLPRGGRQLRELRHRSYLVTPTLDRAREALLAEFNVEHIPRSNLSRKSWPRCPLLHVRGSTSYLHSQEIAGKN